MIQITDYLLVILLTLSRVRSQQQCCLSPENGNCNSIVTEPRCGGLACERACGGVLGTYTRVPGCDGTWSGRIRTIGVDYVPAYLIPPFATVEQGRRLLWGDRKTRNVLRSAPVIGFLYSMTRDEDYGYDDGSLQAETEALALTVASNSENIAILADAQARMRVANLAMEKRMVATFERTSEKIESYRIETQSALSSLVKEAALARSERTVIRQETTFLLRSARQEAIGRIVTLNPLCRKFVKIESLKLIDPDINVEWNTKSVSFMIVSWAFARYITSDRAHLQGALVNVTVTKRRSVASHLLESDQGLWSHTAKIVAFGNSEEGYITHETECVNDLGTCTSSYLAATYGIPTASVVRNPILRNGTIKTGRLTPFKRYNSIGSSECASNEVPYNRCVRTGIVFYSASDCTRIFGVRDCNAKAHIMGAKRTTVFLPAQGLTLFGYKSITEIGGVDDPLEETFSFDGVETGVPSGGGYAYITEFFDPYAVAETMMFPDFPTMTPKVRALMEFGGDTDNVVFGMYGPMIPVTIGEVIGTGAKIVIEPISLSGYSAELIDAIQGLRPFTGWVKTDDCSSDNKTGICCSAIGFGPLVSNIPYLSTALNQTSLIAVLIQTDLSTSAALASAMSKIDSLGNQTALDLLPLYAGLNESEAQNILEAALLARIANLSYANQAQAIAIAKRISEIESTGNTSSWLLWTLTIMGFALSVFTCCVMFYPKVKQGMPI